MKYVTREDLLIAAGESIKMQKSRGILNPKIKYNGVLIEMDDIVFKFCPLDYELPLAVIDEVLIFVDDKLYDKIYNRCVTAEDSDKFSLKASGRWYTFDYYTVQKPQPQTISVEVSREDAECFANSSLLFNAGKRMAEACKKALA